jgi:hypothetical protein
MYRETKICPDTSILEQVIVAGGSNIVWSCFYFLCGHLKMKSNRPQEVRQLAQRPKTFALGLLTCKFVRVPIDHSVEKYFDKNQTCTLHEK